MSATSSAARAWAWDGSLESLLILADLALSAGSWPGSLRSPQPPEAGLFDEAEAGEPCGADPRAAEGALGRLRARGGPLYGLCLEAWMSEEGVEPQLLSLASALGRGEAGAAEDYARPETRILRAACSRVEREVHRLQGLARFSPRSDGLYSALLEPDHNVLPALLPHFARRFGGQAFALVDLRRRVAYLSRGGRIEALSGEEAIALGPDRSDEDAQALWRGYFQAIENPARRNPGLQKRLMPARYWKHLPELARIGERESV